MGYCINCNSYIRENNYCSTESRHSGMYNTCGQYELFSDQDAKEVITLMAGGCTKHEHGTSLYNRCKDWLEAIKVDDSKIKKIRIVFTRSDYPTVLFWRSLMEKLYKKYPSIYLQSRISFRGLTEKMKEEALEIKEIILKENHDSR